MTFKEIDEFASNIDPRSPDPYDQMALNLVWEFKHAFKRLVNARKRYNSNPTEANEEKVRKAGMASDMARQALMNAMG